ncbi:MAG: EAL domain-containing protein [Lachnospiraceae bacterium]|nr:EAL domain-containing protein [Lachnospiraceae bacterium]
MERKKIAVLLAQADESYQNSFLKGIMKRAFELSYDVYAFSMYIKYQDTKEREIGDVNIYNAINYDEFDSVIVLADLIQTPGAVKKIEKKIKECFKGIVLFVDRDSEYFPCFWTTGYRSVYKTISHLIEVHGYKDIAYLTGRRGHQHSEMRLEAYKMAMKDHDLPIKEDHMIYGDFWYTSGAATAEMLLRDRENFPDAVACANDCMAIGLAAELEKSGIKVPEDIAIVGYGTTEEGQNSPRSLTSTYIPAESYGEFSVDALMKLKNGEEIGQPEYEPTLYVGESCGCEMDQSLFNTAKRDSWATADSEESYYSIHNMLLGDLIRSNELSDFLEVVYDNIHYIKGVKSFFLCLNDMWTEPEKLFTAEIINEGYTDQLLAAISYNSDSTCCKISTSECFDKKEMLPEHPIHENPQGYIFTPIYVGDQSIGYAVVSYGDIPSGYEETYRLWMYSISLGFECLRKNYILEALRDGTLRKAFTKFSDLSVFGGATKALPHLSEEEVEELQEVERILDNNLLKYHFQPIVNAVDGRIYSYEALMRSKTEKFISPLKIIKYADILGRLTDIERATFLNVLDIVENSKELFKDRKVFINSIPGSKIERNDVMKIERLLSANAGTIVVELTEQSELQDEELDELKEQYKKMGTELAVDDYGTGYSNVNNLLRYMPDYVKIDRSLLTGIENSKSKQHFVREAIEFCHDNGIMALAEGVETTEELRTVIRLGADLIQGYYVARPKEEIIPSVDESIMQEIARHHKDKVDGIMNMPYIAGQSRRVSLNSLIKEEINTIVIGDKAATHIDLTIAGTPGVKSDMQIEVKEGFEGRITFENVTLSTKKGRPCIRIGENCKLTLKLCGDNVLYGGGILVPESSSILIEGDGDLKLKLSGAETYGIGNDDKSRHGKLEFYQDGDLVIEANGMKCIGIGSGLGGIIEVQRGKFDITIDVDEGVCIGSINGDESISIHDCDMTINAAFHRGVLIGSVNNNIDITIWRSLVKCIGNSSRMAAIGSLNGQRAKVHLYDMSTVINVRGDDTIGIGSIEGDTDFKIETAGIKYLGFGRNAYAFGGHSGKTKVECYNVDMNLDLRTETGKITDASDEDYIKKFVRSEITINGSTVIEQEDQ